MNPVFNGRYTARSDESFVVFLIGMRINRIWAVRRWWPVLSAMAPMIIALERNPEKGYLGSMTTIGARGPLLIQYWRSFEDLERFARDPGDPHLKAWHRFNRGIGSDGSVGIWHETYLVEPGQFETMYGNMPRFGLARALDHVPATGRRDSARGRLQADR
jgi:hypothetical protein